MKTKNILILARSAPYGSIWAAEAYRSAMGFSTSDLPTRLVLIADAVFAAAKGQEAEGIGSGSLSKELTKAEDFDIELFVHGPSLSERSLTPEDIIPVETVDDHSLRKLIAEADHVLTF
jgi:tRNA 2-thiouridine synthesizing protein C